jgi:DNA-directed RNA polymerase subunit RPC12/RpoP
VLGHELDNRLVADDGARCRHCHQRFLFEDGHTTHTRHVLGCLLRHHTYLRIDRRAGHHEYACLRCGHPLLLAVGHDPHPDALPFPTKLKLLCGTFGTVICMLLDPSHHELSAALHGSAQ